MRGAINHKYRMAILLLSATGNKNSNIENSRMPMLTATETTRRLVEVPMVVPMPPIRVAKPIGINIPDAGVPVRKETLIKIGKSRMTMGTLFTKALSTAPTRRVSKNENAGVMVQSLARILPTGSNAPVLDKPCPIIINAVTATRASCPKPE